MPLQKYNCLDCGEEFLRFERLGGEDVKIACQICKSENVRAGGAQADASTKPVAQAGAPTACDISSCNSSGSENTCGSVSDSDDSDKR